MNTLKVLIDNVDVTSKVTKNSKGFVIPASLLIRGTHTISVSVSDMVNNTGSAKWTVTVEITKRAANTRYLSDGAGHPGPAPLAVCQSKRSMTSMIDGKANQNMAGKHGPMKHILLSFCVNSYERWAEPIPMPLYSNSNEKYCFICHLRQAIIGGASPPFAQYSNPQHD